MCHVGTCGLCDPQVLVPSLFYFFLTHCPSEVPLLEQVCSLSEYENGCVPGPLLGRQSGMRWKEGFSGLGKAL